MLCLQMQANWKVMSMPTAVDKLKRSLEFEDKMPRHHARTVKFGLSTVLHTVQGLHARPSSQGLFTFHKRRIKHQPTHSSILHSMSRVSD